MAHFTEEEHTILIDTANRLEAATSRLEDMATAPPDSPQSTPQAAAESSRSLTGASSAASRDGPSPAPLPPPAAPKAEPVPQLVEDYDNVVSTTVAPFVKQAEALGGTIAQQVRGLFHRKIVC